MATEDRIVEEKAGCTYKDELWKALQRYDVSVVLCYTVCHRESMVKMNLSVCF